MATINSTQFHHKEHREWISSLDFYQDEIRIFQKELEKVLFEYPDLYSIIEHVDEYQHILSKKLSQVSSFRRQIILHERHLTDSKSINELDLWGHTETREKLDEFITDFEKLKINFRRFVSKHLHAPS